MGFISRSEGNFLEVSCESGDGGAIRSFGCHPGALRYFTYSGSVSCGGKTSLTACLRTNIWMLEALTYLLLSG